MLGGVTIEHPVGLAGHSDADVLCHAVVDAVLGAGGLGDIGTHFPSTEDRWRGAPGERFLEGARDLLLAGGLRVVNVDATVVCESPRISAHREKMEATIASALGLEPGRVSVKATSTDGMGFTGRDEGIAAFAVALVEDAEAANGR